jgi:glycosyltransferase involved in cell wall biosynthesis
MIKDLVTVIIPVYNKVEYLRDSLNSVINQTYSNIEIIVVDDGSNNSGKILNICNSFNKKIRIIKLNKNSGVSVALNRGILRSNGKYINWLSHDDLFLPTKIEEQIELLSGAEDKISITNFILWNFEKNKKKKIYLNKEDFKNFKENLLLKDVYNFCTLLVPKKLYVNNFFNKKLRYVQDYDMFIKLSKKAEFLFLNKHLFVSRVHSRQTSLVKKNKWIKEKNQFYKNNIFFYLSIINNNQSILNIFRIFFFIHRKNLKQLTFSLDKKINSLYSKKVRIINILVKKIIRVLNCL